MAEELLEKIPPEKRWAITVKTLQNLLFLRGSKAVVPLLGQEEGIFAPVWGWEKFREINTKIWVDIHKKLMHWVKETYNLQVDNAIGSANFAIIWFQLEAGPELKYEIIEESTEKVIIRWTQCPWRNRYQEFGIKPELSFCTPVHQESMDQGLREFNPMLTYRLTKSLLRGNSYCEGVIEFQVE